MTESEWFMKIDVYRTHSCGGSKTWCSASAEPHGAQHLMGKQKKEVDPWETVHMQGKTRGSDRLFYSLMERAVVPSCV